jgi:hypothetical protein
MSSAASSATQQPPGLEAVHAVKNVGTGNAQELATYVVEKGKPLIVAADERTEVS